MAPHSSTLAWKIPWMEKPGRLQSMGLLRVGHDWVIAFSLFTSHFHALEKEMATHSSVLAWRILGTREPGGLLSLGLHRVGHNWSDLAAAAAAGKELISFFVKGHIVNISGFACHRSLLQLSFVIIAHQMVNTKIWLIIYFVAKDGEAVYSQQKQDRELTVAQIMDSLLPNLNLNWRKLGKPLDHSGMT